SDPKTGHAAFFSGDTRFDYPAYVQMMERADVCFHDCQLFDQPDSVHATLSECLSLPESIRKKTFLYHYGDNYDEQALKPSFNQFRGLADPHRRYPIFSSRQPMATQQDAKERANKLA